MAKSFTIAGSVEEPAPVPVIKNRSPEEIKALKRDNLKKIIVNSVQKEMPLDPEKLSGDLSELIGEINFMGGVNKLAIYSIGIRLLKIRNEKLYTDGMNFKEWIEQANQKGELNLGWRQAYEYAGYVEIAGKKLLEIEGDLDVSKLREILPAMRKNPEAIEELLKMSQNKTVKEIREHFKKPKEESSGFFPISGKSSEEEEKIEKMKSLALSLLKKGYEKEKMEKIYSLLCEV